MNNRLITPPRHVDKDRVPDLLMLLMANVEDALLETRATPGQDYTRADLLAAATPLLAAMISSSANPPSIYTEWPEQESQP